MKKIISGLMLLFAALTLTSCIEMTSETELTFEKLPEAVIEGKAEGQLDKTQILVKINGSTYTLEAAEKAGAVVEGDEYTAGYNTLLVTYKDVTIAFTYLVEIQPEQIYDISWYEEGKSEFTLSNAEELRGLAQLVNSGQALFAGKIVKLGADIDLAGYAWTPIGEGARKIAGVEVTDAANTFQGTFDGQNHVIKNLNDGGYVAGKGREYESTAAKRNIYGYAYGLFGVVNAEGVVIKNVKLENVDVNGASIVDGVAYFADSVAGIVGWSGAGYFTIENCHVSGQIKGFDAIGGIIGRIYHGSYTLVNCSNSADVKATLLGGSKNAGIVGYISENASVVMNQCSNKGQVSNDPAQWSDELYVRAGNTVVTLNGTEYKNVGGNAVFGSANEADYIK